MLTRQDSNARLSRQHSKGQAHIHVTYCTLDLNPRTPDSSEQTGAAERTGRDTPQRAHDAHGAAVAIKYSNACWKTQKTLDETKTMNPPKNHVLLVISEPRTELEIILNKFLRFVVEQFPHPNAAKTTRCSIIRHFEITKTKGS